MVFTAAGTLSILISLGIILSLLDGAFGFFRKVELGTLWSEGWFPRQDLFDVRTLFAGTVIVAGIAMAVAGPLGLGAAVYLSEFARPRVRKVLKPVLEVLAGIPRVVLGFFAISFVTPSVIQKLNPDAAFFNLLAAGVCVGILTIPIVGR